MSGVAHGASCLRVVWNKWLTSQRRRRLKGGCAESEDGSVKEAERRETGQGETRQGARSERDEEGISCDRKLVVVQCAQSCTARSTEMYNEACRSSSVELYFTLHSAILAEM